MDGFDKWMGTLNTGKVYSIPVTQQEKENFEHLIHMELVHNEIAKTLRLLKDNIIATRNEYVTHICQKYNIDKPNYMTYDYLTGHIVSTFHQNHATRLIAAPKEFVTIADDMVFKLIQELTKIYKDHETAIVTGKQIGRAHV